MGCRRRGQPGCTSEIFLWLSDVRRFVRRDGSSTPMHAGAMARLPIVSRQWAQSRENIQLLSLPAGTANPCALSPGTQSAAPFRSYLSSTRWAKKKRPSMRAPGLSRVFSRFVRTELDQVYNSNEHARRHAITLGRYQLFMLFVESPDHSNVVFPNAVEFFNRSMDVLLCERTTISVLKNEATQ
jgi:hypothetical protein